MRTANSKTVHPPDALPQTQYAVQLVGPSELRLNAAKEVFTPGPRQILGRVEAVGLCFSDLKLLRQFTDHVRKSEVLAGLTEQTLREIPSYVPGEKPTVPGHECVLRIVAVGEEVEHHKVGERCLVQTDYRDIRTASSNAAFGYNFEGALQEYVLMDERVVMQPNTGQRFLIPVGEDLSASAVALIEPWACVEDSYVNKERRTIKPGGRLLVVADPGYAARGLVESCSSGGKPDSAVIVCAEDSQREALEELAVPVAEEGDLAALPDEGFDDIVYFGVSKLTIEALNDKLAAHGIINIVTAGREIGQPVSVGVGRVHYGPTRWIGTRSASAADAYRNIPETGEIRPGEQIAVIGAAGPMGQMHVIRDVCAGVPDVSVVATDFDDSRLAALAAKTRPLAERLGVDLRFVNPGHEEFAGKFSYIAIMVPAGAVVADAIERGTDGCLINVFAGIPAPTRHELDLDAYIANRCFMFGTSGSVIEDMKIVLGKVDSGQLDTNCSVDAVSGMAGAVEGMAAVENRTLAGKIVVYPALHGLGLVPLSQLKDQFPTVADKLDDGQWTAAAEQELLHVAAGR